MISEFVNAGLVSDLIMVMEPVLFGGGLPLLKDVGQDYKLQLVDTKKLSDNTLRLHYQVGRKGE